MADKKLPVFERDDRSDVTSVVEGLFTVAQIAEDVLIIERYGLSLTAVLIDDGESVEWVATDPLQRYRGSGFSPLAAVSFWDWKRQEVEGKDDDKPRLRVVKDT